MQPIPLKRSAPPRCYFLFATLMFSSNPLLFLSLSFSLSISFFTSFSVYPPRPSRSVSFASCRSPFSPYRQESMIRTDLFNRFRRFLPFHPLHSVTFLLSSFFLPLLSLSLSLSLFHSLPPSLSLSSPLCPSERRLNFYG